MKTEQNRQNLEDMAMYVVWNTANTIKNHFDGDVGSFYKMFNIYGKLRHRNHLQDGDFSNMWKSMRTFNKFLAIDSKLFRRLAGSNRFAEVQMQLSGSTIKLNKGRVTWKDADGTVHQQRFGSRYYTPESVLQTKIEEAGGLEQLLDFNNGMYSPRLKAIVAKESEPEASSEPSDEEKLYDEIYDEDPNYKPSDAAKYDQLPFTDDTSKLECIALLQQAAHLTSNDDDGVGSCFGGWQGKQAEFLRRIQDWVSEKALAYATAQAMLRDVGETPDVRPPRGGACNEEVDQARQTNIVGAFVKVFSEYLEDKGTLQHWLSKWQKLSKAYTSH